jgi:Fur family peroxide stress response transcriptional regulator
MEREMISFSLRIVIRNYLEGDKSHLSAEEIRGAAEKCPTVFLATVCNMLSALERRGYLLKVTIDPSKARYDPNTFLHRHLVCNLCKTIADVDTRHCPTYHS